MTTKKCLLLAALALVCLGAAPQEATATEATPIDTCRTIMKSGSYVLTNGLTGAGNCIVIGVDDVTLDLDGQTIKGGGTGFGIGDDGVPRQNIVIRNGAVRNFERGIALPSSSYITVEWVHAFQNIADGIVTGPEAIIRNNVASRNGGTGIVASGVGSLVSGNIANFNGRVGISTGSWSNLIGNVAVGNDSDDIYAPGYSRGYNNNTGK